MKLGQSLIELLIAIGAISVVMLSIAGAATRAVSVQTSAKQEAQAAKLAEEQIERVRAHRDRQGFNAVVDCSQCSLDRDLVWSTLPRSDGQFTVWFIVSSPPAATCPTENRYITAITAWSDAVGEHQVTVTTCLSGWRH